MLIVLICMSVILSGCGNKFPKTPPTPVLDKNQFIENCMAGERVGECMKYLSWEA